MYEYTRILDDELKISTYDTISVMRDEIKAEFEGFYFLPLAIKRLSGSNKITLLSGTDILSWARGTCSCANKNKNCGLCDV